MSTETTETTTMKKSNRKTKNGVHPKEPKPELARLQPGPAVIPFEQISADVGLNMRGEYPEKEIKALAENIREHGLLEPIGVVYARDHYEVEYGFKRYLALKLLKTKTGVPVMVNAPKTGADFMLANVVENTWRSDVHPVDMAQRLHDLNKGEYPVPDGMKATPIERAVLASVFRMSQELVGNLIRCHENLSGEVKREWRTKDIPLRTVIEWAALKTEEPVYKTDETGKIEKDPETKAPIETGKTRKVPDEEAQAKELERWKAQKAAEAEKAKAEGREPGKKRGKKKDDENRPPNRSEIEEVALKLAEKLASGEHKGAELSELEGKAVAISWVLGPEKAKACGLSPRKTVWR
jgi:ParB-like chromosome segregation protein Spo0J